MAAMAQTLFTPVARRSPLLAPAAVALPTVHVTGNRVNAVRLGDPVEIELESDQGIPVVDSLPVLQLGALEVDAARYPDNSGDTHRLVFSVAAADYARLGPDVPLRLRCGDGLLFDFGRFKKSSF
jgi:hypothetical protein